MASGASASADAAAAYHAGARRGSSAIAGGTRELMTGTMATVLVATWGNGLFALTDGLFHQELPGQSVKGLARDRSGNALAIIGGKSLCRRTADGVWHTLAQGELELSCCVAAGAHLYVGASDAAEVLGVDDD